MTHITKEFPATPTCYVLISYFCCHEPSLQCHASHTSEIVHLSSVSYLFPGPVHPLSAHFRSLPFSRTHLWLIVPLRLNSSYVRACLHDSWVSEPAKRERAASCRVPIALAPSYFSSLSSSFWVIYMVHFNLFFVYSCHECELYQACNVSSLMCIPSCLSKQASLFARSINTKI